MKMKDNPGHRACRSAIALLAFGAGAAFAQGYPNRPVTLIVPFPAGGVTDVSARLVAKKLGEELKQPVVVDNRPGAGASIGAGLVAKAAPDGYTLLVGTLANIVVNSYVYKDTLPYKPLEAFTPVHGTMALPLVVVAKGGSPFKTFAGMIQSARAQPGKLTYGSAGAGSVAHLAAELLQAQSRSALVHVPYKGSAPAITDLLGGNIDLAFDYASSTATHVKAGKLTALAVTGPTRLAALPGVPTLAESGFAGAQVSSWIGLFAPAATPRATVDTLSAAMTRVMANKEVADAIVDAGGTVFPLKPAEFKSFIESEHQRWKPIIEKLDIKPN
ncbi:tripartite tricarboxylate transporter substrate binding protein [Variovorax sp. KK3]|uniref:Bug family tripartite tricarboxylate transporter substrate binding protein n=1 Tax=Variovorax sp. KK3 TaxID=1855728 RepID=UPI00097C0227|nr:tripartite tricarboxylate transporter substrate binding protein [Variovorax sp. KK3]